MSPNNNLSDKDIREALKKYLLSKPTPPQVVVDELSVHNGNAIADIVALDKYAHCFEIKSDKDTLSRLSRQISFYDFTFKKNTLVTTEKYLLKAESLIPDYWGILLAKRTNSVKIVNYRNAKINRNWNAEKALLTLWKSELLEVDSRLSSGKSPRSNSRAQIAKKIVDDTCSRLVQKSFFEILADRFETKYQPFEITKYCL
ncbi:sce7726 family protein [Rheinheimera sp. EpRS3]|uniref:sce7726 family protein n=1 Tax=Rheinheimera sp. EpRS3 TaxID=1712383 RepID=UPI0018D22EEB|nr:sce7726 family protein [Rheinheimera sp. EpRS3]